MNDLTASIIPQGALFGQLQRWYSWCNIRRVFSRSRIRCYIHASPVQSATIQPTLLTFHKPVPWSLGNRRDYHYIGIFNHSIHLFGYPHHTIQTPDAAQSSKSLQRCTSFGKFTHYDIRHCERLFVVASCGFARDGILTAECVVLSCCGCERLLPSIAEVGEYYTEITFV